TLMTPPACITATPADSLWTFFLVFPLPRTSGIYPQEIAVEGGGDYQAAVQDFKNKLEAAKSDLEQAKDRASYSQRLYAKKFISASDLQADLDKVQSTEFAAKKAETDYEVYERYTKVRTKKDFRFKLEDARRTVDRVRLQAEVKEQVAIKERDT